MTTSARSLTGGHVFVIIVAFFGVIIAVNMTLAVLAMRSWTGLAVENGYVASQNFNKDLAQARHQASLGWRETFGYADDRFTLTLTDAAQNPVGRAVATIRLQRPSTDREDHQVTLVETSRGKYEFEASLGPGLWDAETIVHSSDGEVLRHLYRLQVSGGSAK